MFGVGLRPEKAPMLAPQRHIRKNVKLRIAGKVQRDAAGGPSFDFACVERRMAIMEKIGEKRVT
jgi:hypothetical protein